MRAVVTAPRTERSLCFKSLFFSLTIAGILIIPTVASAQSSFTRIYGSVDQSVPIPVVSGPLGQQDAGALQELLDYVKAVNVLKWQGMQAAGTFTGNAGNASQATLTVLDGDQFRLDVQTSRGARSTRISGNFGATQEPGGKPSSMPPTAARTGLLVFPQLLTATFPSSTTAFIDRGLVNIGGQTMHRITMEEPVADSETPVTAQNASVVDLYFDPSTHLLLKSAAAVQLDTADREWYLIVITYGDYQKVQDMLIPCTYSQSLNGEPQWTLQLNSPNLQPSVDSSYFQF